MKKWICIAVAVCLVCALAGWGIGKTQRPQNTQLQLSHRELTLDVDNVLARVLVIGAADKNLQWSSSDENILTVDKNGFILGVSPGVAYVTCTDGTQSAQCVVTVVEQLEKYTLSGPRQIQLRPWEKQTVQYTYTGSGKLAYTTSDPSIAVFENGVLRAKKPGKVILTCTDGLYTTQAEVCVRGWFA